MPLTRKQVNALDPRRSVKAKPSDPTRAAYIAKHGDDAVYELDALTPQQLAAYGPRPQTLPSFFSFPGFSVGPIFFDSQYLLILGVTVVMVTLQFLFFERTHRQLDCCSSLSRSDRGSLHSNTIPVRIFDDTKEDTQASPVEGRIAGARAAMHEHDLEMPKAFVQTGDPSDPKFVRGFLKSQQLEAVLCTTDLVAAKFLQTLSRINISVPQEIRLVGFDDLRVASLLTVPLTTMHQPCRDIAITAFNCLLERMSDPTLPPRAILLSPRLVVRHSCGAYLKASGAGTSL